MKIKILGTRGEVEPSAPYHSHHSGILLNNKLLIDLGEQEFLNYDPKWVLITHLHPDHAFFVRQGNRLEADILIYGPEKETENWSQDKPEIKVQREKFELNDFKITPIPTIHSLIAQSQGYLIEKDSKKFLYTGDLIWIEKKHHNKLKNLDLVITEGSFIKKKGMVRRKEEQIYGHGGVPDLISLFSGFTDRMLITHLGSWFYEDRQKARRKVRSIGKDNNVEAIVAYDGMEVEI